MPFITFGDYEVEPTIYTGSHWEVVPEGEHDYYSVYLRQQPSGEDNHRHAQWLADFEYRSHATSFAEQLALAKEMHP